MFLDNSVAKKLSQLLPAFGVFQGVVAAQDDSGSSVVGPHAVLGRYENFCRQRFATVSADGSARAQRCVRHIQIHIRSTQVPTVEIWSHNCTVDLCERSLESKHTRNRSKRAKTAGVVREQGTRRPSSIARGHLLASQNTAVITWTFYPRSLMQCFQQIFCWEHYTHNPLRSH